MKIEQKLLTSIEDKFRGLGLHDEFKLIKTNFDKRRVEATYKHVDRDMGVNMEMKFFVPKHYVSVHCPVEDIGTLAKICRGLRVHDLYEMHKMNITTETISAEFYNYDDGTSIKIKTLR